MKEWLKLIKRNKFEKFKFEKLIQIHRKFQDQDLDLRTGQETPLLSRTF